MIVNYGSCIVCIAQSSVGTCVLTVIPIPADAEVGLTCPGCTQIGNQIQVPRGSTVAYEVFSPDYVPQAGTISVLSDQNLNITLQSGVLLTINPTPADANVVIKLNGYPYPINHLMVPIDTPVEFEVSKEGYATKKRTVTINEATTINITLNEATAVDLEDYEYTLDEDTNAVLNTYIGTDTNVEVP